MRPEALNDRESWKRWVNMWEPGLEPSRERDPGRGEEAAAVREVTTGWPVRGASVEAGTPGKGVGEADGRLPNRGKRRWNPEGGSEADLDGRASGSAVAKLRDTDDMDVLVHMSSSSAVSFAF